MQQSNPFSAVQEADEELVPSPPIRPMPKMVQTMPDAPPQQSGQIMGFGHAEGHFLEERVFLPDTQHSQDGKGWHDRGMCRFQPCQYRTS